MHRDSYNMVAQLDGFARHMLEQDMDHIFGVCHILMVACRDPFTLYPQIRRTCLR